MAAGPLEAGWHCAAGARFFCTVGRGLEPFLMQEVRARLEATQVSGPLCAPRREGGRPSLHLSPPGSVVDRGKQRDLHALRCRRTVATTAPALGVLPAGSVILEGTASRFSLHIYYRTPVTAEFFFFF